MDLRPIAIFLTALTFVWQSSATSPQMLEVPNNSEGIRTLLNSYPGHLGLTAALKSLTNNRSSTDAYILVLGLNGAGKSSTIKKIFNGQVTGAANAITEHIFPMPLPSLGISNSRLHIIDTPGFGEGAGGTNDDAKLLASIRHFRRAHPDLNSKFPTGVLILSRFDDNRASGDSSKFVLMLKGFELIRSEFVSEPSNIVFLLTRFLSATKDITRRPKDRIDFFSRIITNFTHFPNPILVNVGENNAEEKGVYGTSGSYQLYNKELYPDNLINSLIASAQSNEDPIGEAILKSLLTFRSSNPNLAGIQTVNHALVESNNADIAGLVNTLGTQSLNLEETEVSKALASGYQQLSENQRRSSPGMLQVVQAAFQNYGIKKLEDVPKTSTEIAKLLQTIDLSESTVNLLEKGLGIRVPELYLDSFVVGNGYDILRDESLSSSPFEMEEVQLQPSPLGYKIPSFLNCQIIPTNFNIILHFPSSYMDYVELRKRNFGMEENFDSNKFEGQALEGFNLLDGESTTYSAVQEIIKFQLDLTANPPLNSEFKAAVNTLNPLDTGNSESVKSWKSFFNLYGTHVVKSALGGGSMIATVVVDDTFKSLVRTPSGKSDLQNLLLNFTALSHRTPSHIPDYRYKGGEPVQGMRDISRTHETERTRLLAEWDSSLLVKPQILQSKLSLESLSVYVRMIKPDIAVEVDRAIKLLLAGNLVYARVKPTQKPTPPRTPSTEPPTTVETDNQRPPAPYQPPVMDRPKSNECNCPERTYQALEPLTCPPPIQTPVINQNSQTPKTCPGDSSTSKSNPARTDRTSNIIGQSYNILRDTVLSKTILSLKPDLILQFKNNFSSVDGIRVERILDKNPYCYRRLYRVFQTRQDYLPERLREIDATAASTVRREPAALSRFKGKVQAGFNIIDANDVMKPTTRLEELRMFRLSVDDIMADLVFTEEFRQAVNLLPYFNGNIEREPCDVKNAWVDFFETFGTHLVTSAFVGRSALTMVEGRVFTDNEFPLGPTLKCEVIPPNSDFYPVWLHSDITIGGIYKYVQKIRRELGASPSSALFGYFDGRLKSC